MGFEHSALKRAWGSLLEVSAFFEERKLLQGFLCSAAQPLFLPPPPVLPFFCLIYGLCFLLAACQVGLLEHSYSVPGPTSLTVLLSSCQPRTSRKSKSKLLLNSPPFLPLQWWSWHITLSRDVQPEELLKIRLHKQILSLPASPIYTYEPRSAQQASVCA